MSYHNITRTVYTSLARLFAICCVYNTMSCLPSHAHIMLLAWTALSLPSCQNLSTPTQIPPSLSPEDMISDEKHHSVERLRLNPL